MTLKTIFVTYSPLLRNLTLSAAFSVLVLSLLFGLIIRGGGEVGPALLVKAFQSLSVLWVLAYAGSEFVQAGFRAARYRLLLQVGGKGEVPPMRHLYLVTLARNMLVDLLPGRAGELGYVALLKRGYRVEVENGFSSLAISILLDMVALAAVVFLAMAPMLMELMGAGAYAGATLGVCLLLALAWWGWFTVFPKLMRHPLYLRLTGAWRWIRKPSRFLERLADTIVATRRAKCWGRMLAWSGLVRVGKYTGLYLLFQSVTRAMWPELAELSPWAILLTLILAEGAAALPLPAFMSFGPYEAGGTAALVLMGFEASQAALTLLVVHVVSQAVGYLIGGTALILYLYLAPHRVDHEPVRSPASAVSLRPLLRAWMFPVTMSVIAVLVAGWTYRASTKLGAWTAPEAGKALEMPEEARTQLLEAVGEEEGFLVWSSNRHGNHDILRLTLPGLRVERLTDHPHTETYPRISPDGRHLVFCRSRRPWVSQRNPREWNLVLMDLETGEERILTEFGYQPAWTREGGAVIFVRQGNQLVRHRISDGEEEVLFESGRNGLPDGLEFQTPDPGPEGAPMAVTLRGSHRAAVLLEGGEAPERVVSAAGCQLSWSPDGSFLYWTDHGGPSGLQFFRSPPDANEPGVWLDIPGEYSHQYFPRLNATGEVLVMAASTGGHEHDTADYEIHLWRVGEADARTARVTFHSGNDGWPDLFLGRDSQ